MGQFISSDGYVTKNNDFSVYQFEAMGSAECPRSGVSVFAMTCLGSTPNTGIVTIDYKNRTVVEPNGTSHVELKTDSAGRLFVRVTPPDSGQVILCNLLGPNLDFDNGNRGATTAVESSHASSGVELPAAPDSDGTYTLTSTVSSGEAELSWESSAAS